MPMPRLSLASALEDPKHEQLKIPVKDKRKLFAQNTAASVQLGTSVPVTSNPAIQYRKEAYKIRKNLTKLVQEVNLIQQNKFVDNNKKSNAADASEETQHPT